MADVAAVQPTAPAAREIAAAPASPRKGARRYSNLCCGVCGGVSLALGVLLLLLGIWAAHLYRRFTPVYRDITCRMDPPKLASQQNVAGEVVSAISAILGLGGNAQLKLVTATTCDNPNSYTVEMQSVRPGQVYVGRERRQVARVDQIPKTTLPATGTGSIAAEVSLPLNWQTFGSIIDVALGSLGQAIPIYLESDMQVVIDIRFLLGQFSTSKPFSKKCGFNMVMPAGGQPKLGQMVCGDDFNSLQLPPVSDSAAPGEMELTAIGLAKQEVEEGTKAKNLGLGLMMGICFSLALLLLCGAPWCVLRATGGAKCCARRGKESPDGPDGQVNTEVPAVPIGAARPETEV